MIQLTLLFLATVGLVALLVTLTAWSVRSLRLRVAVALLGLFTLPAFYMAALDLLGRARPMALTALTAAEDPEVLGAKGVEGEAIYLLVDAPSWDSPRHLVLPWDAKTAQQLQDASEAAEADGTVVRLRGERQPDDIVPMFYPEPQPAPPLKVAQSAGSPIILPSQ